MGTSVLVLGESGSGKSTSLRNFKGGEIGIFNVASKPLPFRGGLPTMDAPRHSDIIKELRANTLNAYVIDDANYLMAFENFARAHENGYSKFTDMAYNFEQLLETANNATSRDTVIYFFMHPDTDAGGRVKPKTIGKMLDEKLCIEGMFPVVLMAVHNDAGYAFRVHGSAGEPTKTPLGMFERDEIENDLKEVDGVIREYWGLAPLGRKED